MHEAKCLIVHCSRVCHAAPELDFSVKFEWQCGTAVFSDLVHIYHQDMSKLHVITFWPYDQIELLKMVGRMKSTLGSKDQWCARIIYAFIWEKHTPCPK